MIYSSLTRLFTPDDGKQWKQHLSNIDFIALAPERIAALCEYIRAAESYSEFIKAGGVADAEISLRLAAARAKLGLK